jgi:hypothetical protein
MISHLCDVTFALILKWIWKIYQNDKRLWADLIHAKYQSGGSRFICEVHHSIWFPILEGHSKDQVVLQVGTKAQSSQWETHIF